MEELLILPLQVLFEHNTVDIDVVVLLTETGFFFAPNQTFVAQVVERVGVRVLGTSEVTLGDASERTDSRQGTAVFPIQFCVPAG